MSLLERLKPSSLKTFFRNFLHGGIRVVAAEEATLLQLEVLDAQEQLLERATELARKTRPLRESDDELERQLAADYAVALRETSQLGRAMLGQVSPEERREVLSAPLSGSASGSMPSLTAADPQPSKTTEPTPADQEVSPESMTPSEPPRKRGRPSNAERERRAQTLNGAASSNGLHNPTSSEEPPSRN
jgi:hypothetical protein